MIDESYQEQLNAAAASTVEDAQSLVEVGVVAEWSGGRLVAALVIALGLVLRQSDPAGGADRVAAVVPLLRRVAETPEPPSGVTH